MKYQILILTSTLLSSCGIYISSFRTTVTYDRATLTKAEYRIEDFPDQISPFNNEPLERLVDSIDYKGKAIFKIIVKYDGTVSDVKLKRSNLKVRHNSLIEEAMKHSTWLPFMNSEYGITTVDFWTGIRMQETYSRGWVTPMFPRPINKSKFKK